MKPDLDFLTNSKNLENCVFILNSFSIYAVYNVMLVEAMHIKIPAPITTK